MAQAVRRPLTVEARDRVQVSPYGICGRQSGTGKGSIRISLFPLSILLHRGSQYSYIVSGMDNRPITGRSSKTESHPPK